MRRTVERWELLLLCFFLSLPAFPSVSLDCSSFRPDVSFPYQLFKEGFQPAGTIEVYIQNKGDKAISVEKLFLNGEDISEPPRGGEILWWRLRPQPLPPNAFGEILIRLRNQPKEKLNVKIQFADASQLSLAIPPVPPPIFLETLSFDHSIRNIYLFLRTEDKEAKIKDVRLDGVSILKRTKILGPWRDIYHLVISLPQPLSYGSFHYLGVESDKGKRSGTVFRARDDFFPLGSYGYVRPDVYSANNCNIYASFPPLSREQLDSLGHDKILGISSLGGDSPPKEIVSHPYLWAYYLLDEPDVHDYGVESLPPLRRPGATAMEMVKRERNCYSVDGGKLTFLTIDMTYKPANWFIYGRIADVSNTDPYALAFGADMKLVFDVAESARLAFAPSMPLITYQAYYHEPIGKPSDWRFPRMPSPEEERIMMHYALAGGAKGLLAYIHCTERSESLISHGAEEYPAVWKAIGEVYKNLQLIAPLISRSQPMDIARSEEEGLFLRALVASDALILVCINERGESQRDGYIVKPMENAEIEVSLPPWLKPNTVSEIVEGKPERLSFKIKQDKILQFILPSLTSATLVLLR